MRHPTNNVPIPVLFDLRKRFVKLQRKGRIGGLGIRSHQKLFFGKRCLPGVILVVVPHKQSFASLGCYSWCQLFVAVSTAAIHAAHASPTGKATAKVVLLVCCSGRRCSRICLEGCRFVAANHGQCRRCVWDLVRGSIPIAPIAHLAGVDLSISNLTTDMCQHFHRVGSMNLGWVWSSACRGGRPSG